MKKLRVKNLIIVCLMLIGCLLMGGCAKVYELSEEDEQQIAIYCARATSKYNRILQQGALNIPIPKDDEEKTQPSASTTESLEIDTEAEDTGDQISDIPEPIESTSDGSESPEGTGETESTGDADGTETSDASEASAAEPTDESGASLKNAPGLGHALGVPKLKFSYIGAKDVTNYSFDGYFDLSPSFGNHFLVLEYQVYNSSDKDIDLNVPGLGVSFRATLDGASNTADKTILLNDLSSFNGTIKAKKKQDLVMLFQFEPQYLKNLDNISLQVVSGEEKTLVEMR